MMTPDRAYPGRVARHPLQGVLHRSRLWPQGAIERVLTENRVNNYELTVRAKNGQETLVSYNAATFHDRNDKLQGVFAAARDVTERKRFEQALLETNLELEHA